MSRSVLIFIVLLVVLVVGGGIVWWMVTGSNENANNTNTVNNGTTNSTVTNTNDAVGINVEAGAIDVDRETLLSTSNLRVHSGTLADDFDGQAADEGSTFVVVYYTISTLNEDNTTPTPLHNQNVVLLDDEAEYALLASGGENGSDEGERLGYLRFQVPDDAAGFKLQVTENDEKRTIDLGF